MPKPDDSEKSRRERLEALPESLPEAATNVFGRRDEHRQFIVGKKTFAYYLHHHHNHGVIGLCRKAPPGEQSRLVASDPKRFYVPAYLSVNGWVGVRQELPKVDWNEIERPLIDSYLLLAPKRPAERLEAERCAS
ncbi:MAG TPA: MmcQ/YjbR family DNA-binding protein [Dehalococcoidia bacterium]